MQAEPSFHQGSISAIVSDAGYIEYDAQTDHGNSGSPLFDLQDGTVYGLVTLVNTGATGALQNNFAISANTLKSFLLNSGAQVSIIGGSTPLTPATTSTNSSNTIDAKCGNGMGARLFAALQKSQAELSANDNSSAIRDAQAAVEAANMCSGYFPENCQSEIQCDDSQHFLVVGVQYLGQVNVRIASARMRGDLLNPLRNELNSLLDLCGSPNALSDRPPYQTFRSFMTTSMQLYAKFYRLPQYRNFVDYDSMRACATKLNVSI